MMPRTELVPDRAVCRVCGAKVRAGDGTRDPEPELDDIRARQERTYWLSQQPAEVDGWRRRCAACAEAEDSGTWGSYAVSAIVGESVTEAEGRRAIGRLNRVQFIPGRMRIAVDDAEALGLVAELPTAQNTGRWSGKPWGHVTDDERAVVRRVLREVRNASLSGPCTDGACGFCGRRYAVRWFDGPLRWKDGSEAPLCPACREVWDRRSRPTDLEGIRRVVHEACTGQPVGLGTGAPEGVRAYAQSADADPSGHELPWSWSSKIREHQAAVWTAAPQYAPDDQRAAFEIRHRAEEVRRRRDDQARAEAKAEAVAATAW